MPFLKIIIYFHLIIFLLQDRALFCNPSWPGTCYVELAYLEPTDIHLPLCTGIKGMYYYAQLFYAS